jgi:hypothetical protein
MWAEPEDWLEALRLKERVYLYIWNAERTGASLPQDLDGIILSSYCADNYEAFVTLQYMSSLSADADAEREREMTLLL